LIIPGQVDDVLQDHRPFINWLIIAGTIAAFVFQVISVEEQNAKLPKKIKECKNRPVEDVAKEQGVGEQQLREIEQSVEKDLDKFKGLPHWKRTSAEIKDIQVKQKILKEYFVWEKVRPFILNGWEIKGLLGYSWLHGNILHLLGNMYFLWLFGNAVCAKIGNFRYLPIYLGLGVIAGITHLVFTGGNALGAGGAINGIVGMYLVFFPKNEITCYLAYHRWKEICVNGIWMILLWLAFDMWAVTKGGGGATYFAHSIDFAVGFVLAILMLKLKLVVMEEGYEKSLLQMLAEYRKPAENESTIKQRDLEQPKPVTAEPAELKIIPLEPELPKEEFIQFACSCGERFEVPVKYAGKTGRCPKCKLRVRFPDK